MTSAVEPLGQAGRDADVLIVGAGPVGLTLANLLGQRGVRTLVLEALGELIDYPRAVGIDDEALRVMQTLGLVEEVLEHTIPDQKIYMINGERTILSEVNPTTREFGWPRRNGFVQPLVDQVLLGGLDRFPHVEVRFATEVLDATQDADGVQVTLRTDGGGEQVLSAGYLVGADGGSSSTRKRLGLTFEGETRESKGLVIDVRNDPIGTPHAVFGGDPKRGYASISLPHGLRRWEFTLFPHEPESLAEDDAFIYDLLAEHVPDPKRLDIIRRRVYTHHARIAERFRVGRILLAGDAAHVMPVVGGQGWNSGIRDAVNLGWKLAAVVQGLAGDDLLDTYESERLVHVQQMVAISVGMANEMTDHDAERTRLRDLAAAQRTPEEQAAVRNQAFKPQPKYDIGAVVHTPAATFKTLPDREVPRVAGTIYPQPTVRTTDGVDRLLDDATGQGWRVLVWNNDPTALLGAEAIAAVERLGGALVQIVPSTQLHWAATNAAPGVVVVGDLGTLQAWFDARPTSVVVVRPDHVVAAECLAQELEATLGAVFRAAHLRA
ncbi:bifunctional 3-(3-hydroxy-phenyl)propionate/3-hydroxycinnamic acid hydroxylase MhpA [Nocardioides nematodiphilus]|uniref:bifunctional 3-(3-hydroxy-phenyl)propionate/3-hydroxycinnamic acid hydroxylase MhpA n=1 Tax=Nocardioides nematodiphilus TaxID=2849669 RepID=UPI001CD9DD6E|nr:bifunctional 3-(3-hydroxy-phenyl)propionate/3-hydroxycinnamic acid hydroxylase [Nocardioides nematodiphilus]MCA1983083.1 bifunctional 3-(3-hydroxy-phenyl)propionate/3-hydroxycinnamic acid hydroxylase [Nocardioides nematodiphilus]